MAIITVPKPLQQKLGDEASDALVELLQQSQEEQKEHLFSLLEERFHRKIESEIHLLRIEMKDGFSEIQKQFGEVQKQFGEVQKQFGEIQKQITRQTQWMIGLIGFLAITLKVLDIIFK